MRFEEKYKKWAFSEKDREKALTGIQAENVFEYLKEEKQTLIEKIAKRFKLNPFEKYDEGINSALRQIIKLIKEQ